MLRFKKVIRKIFVKKFGSNLYTCICIFTCVFRIFRHSLNHKFTMPQSTRDSFHITSPRWISRRTFITSSSDLPTSVFIVPLSRTVTVTLWDPYILNFIPRQVQGYKKWTYALSLLVINFFFREILN